MKKTFAFIGAGWVVALAFLSAAPHPADKTFALKGIPQRVRPEQVIEVPETVIVAERPELRLPEVVIRANINRGAGSAYTQRPEGHTQRSCKTRLLVQGSGTVRECD